MHIVSQLHTNVYVYIKPMHQNVSCFLWMVELQAILCPSIFSTFFTISTIMGYSQGGK